MTKTRSPFKPVIILTSIALLVVAGLGARELNTRLRTQKYHANPNAFPSYSLRAQQSALPLPSATRTVTPLPDRILLNVPFLPQAPGGNWDELHNEACEEASFLMVKHFYRETVPTEQSGDKEIIDLVNYETELGYAVDITVKQLSEIARSPRNNLAHPRIATEFTIEDMKRELAAGRPIIIPAAGQQLGNPYFRNPGPPYHMLVIKGYDEKGFITNDPGTRHGKDFRYTFDVLYNAIHDWNGSTRTIATGPKAYLVFD